jgi:hypothetical protein
MITIGALNCEERLPLPALLMTNCCTGARSCFSGLQDEPLISPFP